MSIAHRAGRVLSVVLVGAAAFVTPAAPAQPAQVFPPLLPGEEPPTAQPARDRLGAALAWVTREEGARLDADDFSPAFRRQANIDHLREAMRSFGIDRNGVSIVGRALNDAHTATAGLRTGNGETWLMTVRIEPLPPYRIDLLRLDLTPRVERAGYDGWPLLDADLRSLGIAASFAAWELGPDGSMRPLHRLQGERRMSIGTTATVFALGAAARLVAAGGASWDDPLPIDPALVSIPKGRFGDLPPGLGLTVIDHAIALMHENDMTAADHLAWLVGRQAVEEEMRASRLAALRDAGLDERLADAKSEDLPPYLLVHDLYRLKCSIDGFFLMEYAEADPTEQRRLLAEDVPQQQAVPQLVVAWRRPQQVLSVGWFASADDLCHAMARLHTLAGEPGMEPLAAALQAPESEPYDRGLWRSLSVRRGGEPGAMSSVWLAERHDGRRFVVAMVLNNQSGGVAPAKPTTMLNSAFGLLGRLR